MNMYRVGMILCAVVVSFNCIASQERVTNQTQQRLTFENADTSGDGLISLSELEAYRNEMQMRQGNASGKQMNRKDSVSAFATFDTNKDGVITREEFEAHNRYMMKLGDGTGDMNMNRETNRNSMQNQSGNQNGSSGSGSGNGAQNGKNN